MLDWLLLLAFLVQAASPQAALCSLDPSLTVLTSARTPQTLQDQFRLEQLQCPFPLLYVRSAGDVTELVQGMWVDVLSLVVQEGREDREVEGLERMIGSGASLCLHSSEFSRKSGKYGSKAWNRCGCI